MEVTTKELPIHPGRILDQVLNGDDVTVTYRGKPIAKIVPLEQRETDEAPQGIFGMWADREDEASVEDTVRRVRQGRTFRYSILTY
jgi:prevent-host-death family protein